MLPHALGLFLLASPVFSQVGDQHFSGDVEIKGKLFMPRTAAAPSWVELQVPVTGQLTIEGNTTFTGTVTHRAALGFDSGTSLTLTGPGGYLSSQSSITTTGGLFGIGTAITALNATNLDSGTVPNARLDSASVTLQANVFNGANQLLQAQADGFIDDADVDPSSVTKFNASGLISNFQIDGSSIAKVSGNPRFNSIAVDQSSATIGNWRFGTLDGLPAYSYIGHQSIAPSGNDFALTQNDSGDTILNAKSGRSVSFNINNSAIATIVGTTMGVSSTTPTDTLSVGGSINVSGSYKRGTRTGSTISACTSSQYIGSAEVVGGILVAGTCTADSGLTYVSTQTILGSDQSSIGTGWTLLTNSSVTLSGIVVGSTMTCTFCTTDNENTGTDQSLYRIVVDGILPGGTGAGTFAVDHSASDKNVSGCGVRRFLTTATSHIIHVDARTAGNTFDLQCSFFNCPLFCEAH